MSAGTQIAVHRNEVQPDMIRGHLYRRGITIGIPAYNEGESIGLLLRDILSQSSFGVVEIVVCTCGSTDGSAQRVREVASDFQNVDCKIKLIDGRHRLGKAAAMDEILRKAIGDIIVFIDADTRVGKHCIDRIIAPLLEDEKVGLVSGNILPIKPDGEMTWFYFASRFLRELHHHVCLQLQNRDMPPKVNGTFFAVRKEVIRRLPHDVVSDDEYVSWCAQKLGYRVIYAPIALVHTLDPTNLKDYISKRRRILGGHFLIKNTLGYKVPTTDMSTLLPLFTRLATKHGRRLFWLTSVSFLECYCRLLAQIDASRKSVSPCYRIGSAKLSPKRSSRNH